MLYTIPEFLLLILSIVLLGVVIGLLIRKYTQKHDCPHCSCNDRCTIGVSVQSEKNTELIPFACRQDKRG